MEADHEQDGNRPGSRADVGREGVEVTIPGRDRKKLGQAIAPLSGTVHGIETDPGTADGASP
jgi:hypothetical protein